LLHRVVTRTFLDQLDRELSPDLTEYYHARAGAYGENWTPRDDNPWTGKKLNDTRRRAADLISLLQSIEE
jgi:hypothetical protein